MPRTSNPRWYLVYGPTNRKRPAKPQPVRQRRKLRVRGDLLKCDLPRDPRAKDDPMYIAVPSGAVPGGMKWKRQKGSRFCDGVYIEYTMGKLYKRVTHKPTNVTSYFMYIDQGPPMSPKEQIDAEPENPYAGCRYRLGTECWFVDTDGRWYLVTVAARTQQPPRITIRPSTGRDAERVKDWPYGNELEFPAGPNNRLFQRLRPFKAKRV